MQLWMLDIPRWCWCITCWSSFSIQNVFLSQLCFFRCFFLVVPNTWSINHQMGSEDRGLWPWRPPWRSPWTTSSLPGAWTSQVRRYFFIRPKSFPHQTCGKGCFEWKSKRRRLQLRNYSLRNSRQVLNIIYPWRKHPSQNNRFEEVFHKGWVLLMVVVV